MTQNFPKLTTMTEVRKNSTETTTFSKLSARKMSKLKISAKANTPKRRFRSQKNCDAEIKVSAELRSGGSACAGVAEVEVPLLRKLQKICLSVTGLPILARDTRCSAYIMLCCLRSKTRKTRPDLDLETDSKYCQSYQSLEIN